MTVTNITTFDLIDTGLGDFTATWTQLEEGWGLPGAVLVIDPETGDTHLFEGLTSHSDDMKVTHWTYWCNATGGTLTVLDE